MPAQDHDARRVSAENKGSGILPMHQGGGDLGVNVGDNSVQNNIRQQNVFHNVDIDTLLRVTHAKDCGEHGPKEPSRVDAIQWLTKSLTHFQDLESHHQLLLSQIVSGTGTWVLSRDEFQTWRNTSANLLCLYGNLGAGKTMLASLIIDSIKEAVGNVACVYLYFQGAQDHQPSFAHIFIHLLKQLLQQQPTDEICEDLKTKYEAYDRLGKLPTPDQYFDLFTSVCTAFTEVYLIIDALDDCQSSLEEKLQEKMQNAIKSLRSQIKILVTSRTSWFNEADLRADRELCIIPDPEDIKRYVKSRIKGDNTMQRTIGRSEIPDFQDVVIGKVAAATQGVFLITKLHMDHLCEQKTPGEINTALSELPESVSSAFEASIQQIKKKDASKERKFKQGLAQHVLTWVTNAVTPLTADQICLGFALQYSGSRINKEYVPDENDLMFVCAGLVTIDPTSRVLRLVHESVRRHLVKHSIIPEQAHIEMAKACLTCLLLDESDDKVEQPLLRYSARHWITHVRQAKGDDKWHETQSLVLKFLNDNEKLSRAFQAIPGERSAAFRGMSGLHAAVYFNDRDWAKNIIANGVSVNSTCRDGKTPLHWAVKYGRESLAELLIQDEADIDAQDDTGNAPLHVALMWSAVDCKGIVKQLVKANARVDIPGRKGLSPLAWAIQYGLPSDVEMLVANQKNINAEDDRGWTPLREAISCGLTDIACLLLEKGADPNQVSAKDRWTPLASAARDEYVELARHLIDNKADVNHRDKETGVTPLRWAIYYGRAKLVQLLIDRGANLTDVAQDGLTPLLAAVSGRKTTVPDSKKTIVWMLLENGAATNDRDKDERTSLHLAVGDQDRSIAWLLVTYGASPALKDRRGLTALDWAVAHNDISLTWMLCEHGANADDTDGKRLSALHRASAAGFTEIVRYFLDRGVKFDQADVKGLTALHHATSHNRRDVVALLASRRADLEKQDCQGSTALHIALWKRNQELIQVLLDNGASCDVRDTRGKTVLHWAAGEKFNQELNILVTRTAALDLQDVDHEFTALHHAAYSGDAETIQILVHGGANKGAEDKHGRTPLRLATQVERGLEIYRLLSTS